MKKMKIRAKTKAKMKKKEEEKKKEKRRRKRRKRVRRGRRRVEDLERKKERNLQAPSTIWHNLMLQLVKKKNCLQESLLLRDGHSTHFKSLSYHLYIYILHDKFLERLLKG